MHHHYLKLSIGSLVSNTSARTQTGTRACLF